MSELEKNIRRLVRNAEQGKLLELTQRDRADLQLLVNFDVVPYERNNWSDNVPVFGELTLREVKLARKLGLAKPATL